MTQPTIKGLVRLSLLEQVSPELLVRFLRPYEQFLADRGVGLEGAEQDSEWVHRLHAVLTRADPELPGKLQEALLSVSDLATDQGHEMSLEVAGERQRSLFPIGSELSREDLAFKLYLDANEDFAATHARVRSQEVRRFLSFFPEHPRSITGLLTESRRVQLFNQLRRWFGSRNRSEYVEVQIAEDDQEVTFQIVHGKQPRSLGVVTSAFSRDRLCVIPAGEDMAVFEKETGRLSISAQCTSDCDFYRQALGKVYFDDDEHFKARTILSGAPLLDDAEQALSAEGITGLERVELREVTLKALGWPYEKLSWSARDLSTVIIEELPQLLERERKIIKLKLALKLAGLTRPKTVGLEPPNKLDYDRRTGEEVVRDFLFSRGYMILPKGRSYQVAV